MSDVWVTESVTVSATSSLSGAGVSSRPVGYDPTLSWDIDTSSWVDSSLLRAAGGGRYKPVFVILGRDDTGYGRIYFE